MTMSVKKCEYCGKEFILKASGAKRFCSRVCMKRSMFKQVNITCHYCGKVFMVQPHRLNTVKFCSRSCNGRYTSTGRSRKGQIAWNKGIHTGMVPRSAWKPGRIQPEEERQKWAISQAIALKKGASDIELAFYKSLDGIGVRYEPQVPIGRFIVDALIENTVVELDTGWHGTSRSVENDKRKESWLRSRGYEVIRCKVNENKSNIEELARYVATEHTRDKCQICGREAEDGLVCERCKIEAQKAN